MVTLTRSMITQKNPLVLKPVPSKKRSGTVVRRLREARRKEETRQPLVLTAIDSKSSAISLGNLIEACEQFNDQKKKLIVKGKKRLTNTLERLCVILPELKELAEMVGMDKVKQTVAEHVIYMAQGLMSEEDMNHIQIMGDPGVGKTTLAIILGRIYSGLGYLSSGDVITVTRADMVGEHLGSTTQKTQTVLESCMGNVMLIDEVYSFGCYDKRDSFAKECIDCINQFLSENRNDILCIIAGYEQDIKECVFTLNKGLERRFPWKYRLEKYSPNELRAVFVAQAEREKWHFEESEETNIELQRIFNPRDVSTMFSSSGGDTEILFVRCKMAHSTRLFAQTANNLNSGKKVKRKLLVPLDLRRGFDCYVQSKKLATETSRIENVAMMYV